MKNISETLLLFIFLFAALPISAQTISIQSVSLMPADKSAINQVCTDINGDTCALLKIKTDQVEGIQFPNSSQYIKSDYIDGIYWVYVPTINRKLDLLHKDYLPVTLDLGDFGYRRLKSGKTYVVTLDMPRITELKSSVILKVEPSNSKVIFDEKDYGTSPSGTFEIPISSGRHSYMVYLDNYSPTNSTIIVGKNEVKTITIRLHPILHSVTVGSNVNNARVYVDNVDYGRVGKLMLPQGEHNIRVQADGFVDSEKNVMITSSTAPLSFILKENAKVTHVHATPVKILSSSSRIYKNNKQIKGWTTGATIMFMPGEYMLSDDEGNTKIIIVGTKPMLVRL